MEYPKTDSEIRIYCIEISRRNPSGSFLEGEPDMEKAQMYYDFICPLSSSRQEEGRIPPREPQRRSLLSSLRRFLRLR